MRRLSILHVKNATGANHKSGCVEGSRKLVPREAALAEAEAGAPLDSDDRSRSLFRRRFFFLFLATPLPSPPGAPSEMGDPGTKVEPP